VDGYTRIPPMDWDFTMGFNVENTHITKVSLKLHEIILIEIPRYSTNFWVFFIFIEYLTCLCVYPVHATSESHEPTKF
jgi:hypothetical protein